MFLNFDFLLLSMNDIDLLWLLEQSKEIKKGRKYLQNYSKLSEKEKKNSRQQNKEFWNDMMSSEKLKEDKIKRKFPNLKNCLRDSEFEYSPKNKDQN